MGWRMRMEQELLMKEVSEEEEKELER